MKKDKLFDSLDGLCAFDSGCVDSGIKDESLRREVKEYISSLNVDDFRIIMTEFIRKYYVCEEAVEKGYGIEDVKGFIDWLDSHMDCSL